MPLGLPELGQEIVVQTDNGYTYTLRRTAETYPHPDYPALMNVSVVSNEPDLPDGAHILLWEDVFEKEGHFQLQCVDGNGHPTLKFTSGRITHVTVQ